MSCRTGERAMTDNQQQDDVTEERQAEQVPEPERDPEREDSAYVLDQKSVGRIMYAVDIGDQAMLWQELEPFHPADIADLLEQINSFDRRRLIELYGHEFEGDVLTELDESIREEVISILSPEVLTNAVRDLESDDVVDLV